MRPTATSVEAESLADELFGGISRPAIDLRRAQEVLPEEPPWRSRFIPRKDIDVKARPPAPVKPVTDGFPAELMEPSESGSPSRPGAILASEEDWPNSFMDHHAAADDGHSRAGEIHSTQGVEVREFSVMVRRLGSRERKRRYAWIGGIVAASVLAVAGSVLAFVTFDPFDQFGHDQMPTEVSDIVVRLETPARPVPAPAPARVARDEVPRSTIIESLESSDGAASARARPRPASDGSAPGAAPPVASAGNIDPSSRDDFNRYGNLLASASQDREEVPIQVQPRTVATLPGNPVSEDGMQEFLENKYRHFLVCKERMARKVNQRIRVELSFSITDRGEIQNIRVEPLGGLRDTGLSDCIRGIVQGWAFPSQSSSRDIRTTLML
jgi:hypothetical protein